MDQTIEETKPKTGGEFDKSWERLSRRSKVAMTGNVYFPKYGTDDSETQRGDLAIKNLIKELEQGYKCLFLVSHKIEPGDLFMGRLEDSLSKATVNENNLQLFRQNIEGYGATRKFLMQEAVSQFPETEVVFQGEAEKDLTPFIDDFVKPLFEEGVGIVTMKRESLKSLPFYQRMGETIQDSLIHGMQKEAGFTVDEKVEDILNGTRFIENKPLETKYARMVNPLDIFVKMDFAYTEEAANEVKGIYKFGIDKYCSAVYFPLVVARELGIKVKQVKVPYKHDENQTKLEDREERFLDKRVDQAKDIVAQHFDLVATILDYKERGKWPQVLWEAIDGKKALILKHYDMSEWRIEGGKVVRREK